MSKLKCYEEYDSPTARRKAQRGASRGKTTGKAKGYLVVFYGDRQDGKWDGLGEVMQHAPPENPQLVSHVDGHADFLRTHCRSIAWRELPEKWRHCFLNELTKRIGLDDPDYPKVQRLLKLEQNHVH